MGLKRLLGLVKSDVEKPAPADTLPSVGVLVAACPHWEGGVAHAYHDAAFGTHAGEDISWLITCDACTTVAGVAIGRFMRVLSVDAERGAVVYGPPGPTETPP